MEDLGVNHHWNPRDIPITGFQWDMIFIWKRIPEFEVRRRKNENDPINSPTMLGAFFVIDKEYFEQLGMYDKGFEIWGESYENFFGKRLFILNILNFLLLLNNYLNF
jgi:GT2 family glycosyltransferase